MKPQACPECGQNLKVVGWEPAPSGANYVCQRHHPYLYFHYWQKGKKSDLVRFDRLQDAHLFPKECP